MPFLSLTLFVHRFHVKV